MSGQEDGRGRGRGRGAGGRPLVNTNTFRPRGSGDRGARGQGYGHQDGGSRGRGDGYQGGDGRRGDNFQRGGQRGGGYGNRGRGGETPQPFNQGQYSMTPNKEVSDLEVKIFDPSVQSIDVMIKNLNLNSNNEIARRPAYATRGKDISLYANYFQLTATPKRSLNVYSVSVEPVGKAKKIQGKTLARFFQLLLLELPSSVKVVTDYSGILVANQTMGFTERSFSIQYFRETETSPDDQSPTYTAKVQYTGSSTLTDLLGYLSSTDLMKTEFPSKDRVIQALNIILGFSLKSSGSVLTKTSKNARNKYFPIDGDLVEMGELVAGLQAYRGFFMSVRPATGRLLLNVQTQHIAVYEAQPLVELFQKLGEDGKTWAEVESMVKGLWVQATHLKNRLKQISGFAKPQDGRKQDKPPAIPRFASNANNTKFYKHSLEPPRYVTVTQHYKQTYNIDLVQPDFPVVNVGTTGEPNYMPAELCRIKKGQDFRTKLSPFATAAMIKFAVRPAPDNAKTIFENGRRLIEQNSAKTLQDFGIACGKTLITVPARILNGFAPTYLSPREPLNLKDGSWNMNGVKFTRGEKLPSWTTLWIRTNSPRGPLRSTDDLNVCVEKFSKMLCNCGLEASKPTKGIVLTISNQRDPLPEIDRCFRGVKDISLLLVILPNNGTAIYNAVKIAGDISYGIHTVAVLGDGRKFAGALTGSNDQYFANVALKFNLKLGGVNQQLLSTDLGFVGEGKTMLVGMDVTHPSPGSTKTAPSISCITASVNRYLAQWPADVRVQKGRQEMIEYLKSMFKSRLSLWQKNNNQALPEEILVYRDGVGETMYDLVLQTELPQIREACNEVYPATATKKDLPYITVIICGKRHHTRFYPTKREDADQRGATKNGTVVDRGVTESRIWDFYLQAHTALHGTPKSAHYVVIHDEIFRRRAAVAKKDVNDKRTASQRAADDLEKLTHALCYMFGRATKAVSLVPPAYYADLVCDRARRHLSRVFDERSAVSGEAPARDEDVRVHDNLKDSMYYI